MESEKNEKKIKKKRNATNQKNSEKTYTGAKKTVKIVNVKMGGIFYLHVGNYEKKQKS